MRYKIVVRHQVNETGEVVGIEYAVVSVNQDGFERRETGWTSKAQAERQLASYRNHAVARAS